ncbi:MAG: hypothetical protein QMB62_01190 [Oscillospiraceae bacterium]
MTEEDIRKQIKRAKRFNYTVFVIFTIIAVIIGVSVIKYEVRHEYSPSKWAKSPSHRIEIVNDMLSETEMKGMTKAQVIALLGKESDSNANDTEDTMTYYLGVERGLTSDSEWLKIYFTDGRVSNYKVTFG